MQFISNNKIGVKTFKSITYPTQLNTVKKSNRKVG